VRALAAANAGGFRYNAGRLELEQAVAVMAGALGPAFSVAQVQPLLERARANLDACRFFLPASKYDVYSNKLRVHEQQVALTRGAEPSSVLVHATRVGRDAVVEAPGRRCAKCGCGSIEMPRCSGCRRVFYCSKKCQREHWPDHKAACRAWQAELAAAAPKRTADVPAVGNTVDVFLAGRAQRYKVAHVSVARTFGDGTWALEFK
jgi:hypothetical protein